MSLDVHSWFHDVIDYLTDLLEEGQIFCCRLTAEDSDFVRLNESRIRQCGNISQRILQVQLIQGDRQVSGRIGLSGAIAQDRYPLRDLHGRLSNALAEVPPDPHLSYPTGADSSEDREQDQLAPLAVILPEIVESVRGIDLVGHYIGGRIVEAFATSLGLRRWYETHTYDLETSLCLEGDRAVKIVLGGNRWDVDEWRRRLARAAGHAGRLGQDRVRLEPGEYRAYIAPLGWKMILRTLGWRGAFSYRALRNGTSPFSALHEGRRLSPELSLDENNRLGWVAPFSAQGFPRPPQLSLIEQGQPRSLLVSPRTAAEFGVPSTGADAEFPLSFEIAPGRLAADEIAASIGDGLWLEALHYLNLSDRASASITGLTRFAAFRVEGGVLTRPIEVARFDDSILELLGDRLVGLTADRQRVSEGRSYGARVLGGGLLPGAVVDGLRIVS